MCVHCGHIFFLKPLKLYHGEFGHKSISNPGAVSRVANIKICAKTPMWFNFMTSLPTSYFIYLLHVQKFYNMIVLFTPSKKTIFCKPNESHYLDFSLYPPSSHLIFPQNMILDSWYSLLIRSPISMTQVLKQSIVSGYGTQGTVSGKWKLNDK